MSAAKRKGDAFERDVARVFREHGHPYAERMLGLGRHRDDGDIGNVVGFHIECKACKAFALASWMDEARSEAEAIRNDARAEEPRLLLIEPLVPVVVVKRPGKSAEHAYAVVELATFAELIR